jgi:hypothetical protein
MSPIFSAAAHLKQRGLGGGADSFSRPTPRCKGCARALIGGCDRGGVLATGKRIGSADLTTPCGNRDLVADGRWTPSGKGAVGLFGRVTRLWPERLLLATSGRSLAGPSLGGSNSRAESRCGGGGRYGSDTQGPAQTSLVGCSVRAHDEQGCGRPVRGAAVHVWERRQRPLAPESPKRRKSGAIFRAPAGRRPTRPF